MPAGWLFVLTGILLVVGATWMAQRFEVGERIQLDLRGARAQGEAEPLPDGSFRISYKHPAGTIYARRMSGGLGLQRAGTDGAIAISYDPGNPDRFQPAWISVLPGVPSLCLFLAGFWCVLHARRLVMDARRRAPAKRS